MRHCSDWLVAQILPIPTGAAAPDRHDPKAARAAAAAPFRPARSSARTRPHAMSSGPTRKDDGAPSAPETSQADKPQVRIARVEQRVILALPHQAVDDPDTASPHPAQVPVRTGHAPREAAEAAADPRRTFLRDLRRAWMSGPFKHQPFTLLIVSVRLDGDGARSSGRMVAEAAEAIAQALGDLAPVSRFGPATAAVLLPGKTVRQATRIADAVRTAIEQRSRPDARLMLAAGITALTRHDDPVATFAKAERSLAMAESAPQSRIVSEGGGGAADGQPATRR